MGYQVFGLPGPVWTMALWASVSAAVGAGRLGSGTPRASWWLAAIATDLLVVAVLLVLRRATPTWVLAVMTGVEIVVSAAIIAVTLLPTVVTTISTTMVVAVLYVGLWWPGRAAWVCAAGSSIALLFAYVVSPTVTDEVAVWATMTAILVALAGGLSIVVRRGAALASRDPLTGLLNRAGIEEYLRVHPRAGRAVLPRTVVVIDVDDFKRLNDTQGHAAGDDALRRLADAWRAELRPDDVAARLGGDEFVLMLPRTSADGALDLVGRLRDRCDLAWSAGATDWPADEEFSDALRRADRLMYADKYRRRGTGPER
jgi:diguanylate cyclase (GGDEF)-like protein